MASDDRQSPNCPNCGSGATRHSRGNLLDRVGTIAGYQVYRCRKCEQRFRLRAPLMAFEPRNKSRSENRTRRRNLKRREFVVYAAAMMAFAFAVYVITHEGG